MRSAGITTPKKTDGWDQDPEADMFAFVSDASEPDPLAASEWNVVHIDVFNAPPACDDRSGAEEPALPLEFTEADLILL